MGNCLIIGNGLNRAYGMSSWGDLITEFAKDRGIEANLEIPFPLEFERIMNNYFDAKPKIKRNEAYSRAKKRIAKKIEKISIDKGAVKKMIDSVVHDSIITTNYDFSIEDAIGVSNCKQNCVGRRSYISNSTSSFSGVTYYHPHGVVSNPSTICLGYVNYLKICSDLNKVLAFKKKNKNSEMGILRHLNGTETIADHWGTKFYDSNCAIIGLGLDTSEIDLWWLLAHRASITKQKIGGADILVSNTIVYYDIVDTSIERKKAGEKVEEYILRLVEGEEKRKRSVNKYELLTSMGVVVKPVNISDGVDYKEAYAAIFDDLNHYGIDKGIRSITL